MSTLPVRARLIVLLALAAGLVLVPAPHGRLVDAAVTQQAQGTRVFMPLLDATLFTDPDLDAVVAASKGLLYPSEADFAFAPFQWASTPHLAPGAVCERMAALRNQPYELRTITELFAQLAQVEAGASPERLAEAQRFATLGVTIRSRLADATSCRIGELRIDVYLIGVSAQQHIVGLHTIAIET